MCGYCSAICLRRQKKPPRKMLQNRISGLGLDDHTARPLKVSLDEFRRLQLMGLASPPRSAKPAEPPLHKKEEPPQARTAWVSNGMTARLGCRGSRTPGPAKLTQQKEEPPQARTAWVSNGMTARLGCRGSRTPGPAKLTQQKEEPPQARTAWVSNGMTARLGCRGSRTPGPAKLTHKKEEPPQARTAWVPTLAYPDRFIIMLMDGRGTNGGDGGIRTRDLRVANATLSQLSHTPTIRLISYFIISLRSRVLMNAPSSSLTSGC